MVAKFERFHIECVVVVVVAATAFTATAKFSVHIFEICNNVFISQSMGCDKSRKNMYISHTNLNNPMMKPNTLFRL